MVGLLGIHFYGTPGIDELARVVSTVACLVLGAAWRARPVLLEQGLDAFAVRGARVPFHKGAGALAELRAATEPVYPLQRRREHGANAGGGVSTIGVSDEALTAPAR